MYFPSKWPLKGGCCHCDSVSAKTGTTSK
jgi:hypothetical protein